jgi:hypothetical protein
MKRATPVFLFAALTALAFTLAARAADPSRPVRPPGISGSSWVPITHDLGVVVEQQIPDRDSGGRGLPSALGYFVVWRNSHWVRLDSLLLHSRTLQSVPAQTEWLPIARNLRFVIEQQTLGQPMRGEPPTPFALGYFAIERSGEWLQLKPDAEGALYRGPLRPGSKSNWLPIGKGLRFVIEQQMPERDVGAGQAPSVLGYFMGKRAGNWLRLGSVA